MIYILIFSLCCLTAGAQNIPSYYSYSPSVGGGSGTTYASSDVGRITAVRVWESSSAYIRGIQLRYDYRWTPIFGRKISEKQEIELFDGEAIVQISGKYTSSYIYQLSFVTNKGRSLNAGQPSGTSFNFYAPNNKTELLLISGRSNGNGITSIGAHWGIVPPEALGVPQDKNERILALT